MTRKSKSAKEEYEKAYSRLQEINDIRQIAEAEEIKTLEDTETTIKNLCSEQGLFCGVILTPEDISNVITLAIKTGENVKIAFKLFYND